MACQTLPVRMLYATTQGHSISGWRKGSPLIQRVDAFLSWMRRDHELFQLPQIPQKALMQTWLLVTERLTESISMDLKIRNSVHLLSILKIAISMSVRLVNRKFMNSIRMEKLFPLLI